MWVPSFSPSPPIPMLISLEDTFRDVGPFLVNLVAALGILVVGYLVAKLIAGLVERLLNRTRLDDHIADTLGQKDTTRLESTIGTIVFYVVMVFVFVGFFQVLGLSFLSEPLAGFMDRVLAFVPQLIAAGLLGLVAYLVASVLRTLTRHLLEAVDLDSRLRKHVGPTESEEPVVSGAVLHSGVPIPSETPAAPSAAEPHVSKALANAVFYLVLLLFLLPIMSTLQLGGILSPVEGMVYELLNFLPNLLAAGLILVAGYFVAKLVQRLVTALLVSFGTDRLAERVGIKNVLGDQSLSHVVGVIVYVLVLLPVLVAALGALDLGAVTAPASRMLDIVLSAIPQIFGAVLVVTIAYVVGKIVAGLVANLLSSFGFDRLMDNLGLTTPAGTRDPSSIAGSLVLIAVVLFAAMEAASLLGFDALTVVIVEFLEFGGKVLIALLIFGLALYLSRIAGDAVRQSGVGQAQTLAWVTRAAVIVLGCAMALRQLGVANSIINLAFGLTLGAVAVAAAIAFGWGGYPVAREKLRQWTNTGAASIVSPDSPPRASGDDSPSGDTPR